MALTLLNAIKDKWDSTESLTSKITGGLFLCQAPEKLGSSRLDLPYCTVDVDRTRFGWTFSETAYEITEVTFHLLVAGSAATLELYTQHIRDAFDWCTLKFADLTKSTYFQPLDFAVMCEPGTKYRDGSMVYRSTLRYEAFLSKLRPHYP